MVYLLSNKLILKKIICCSLANHLRHIFLVILHLFGYCIIFVIVRVSIKSGINGRKTLLVTFRINTTTTTTVLQPFFLDHPGEPVPEDNFWTLWCKGRLTEAETPTIWLGVTPSGLTSAHLHHPPIFFTCRMLFLPPNQQHQSIEGNIQN